MNMSVNIALPMPQMKPPTLTDGFVASMNGFIRSLPLLATSGGEHVRALSLVAGFIVECALKAYLSHQEMTEKVLMFNPMGTTLRRFG